MALPPALARRLADGFTTPCLVALPDLTLPARRDSQYAISLRQWRYAESFELGLARDPASAPLAAALGRLYDGDAPPGDTGRWRSAAESERNEPPVALTRADLGWRSLLHAPAGPPPADDWAPGAVHLASQGLAVFRRDAGRLWVAVDYGQSGGGHGHPDRLNLLVSDGATRWLDDMGTGSYVERALHWYRSTLAHQAPLVDGASQPRADGVLVDLAMEGGDEVIEAAARLAPDVDAVRRVRVDGVVVVDHLAWRAPREVTLDLPWHVDGDASLPDGAEPRWEPTTRVGAGGLEDGFDFVDGAERLPLGQGAVVRLALHAPAGGRSDAALWLLAAAGAELWRGSAPGPPGVGARRFHVVRAVGAHGALSAVLDVRGQVADVRHTAGGVEVVRRDGSRAVHEAPRHVPSVPVPGPAAPMGPAARATCRGRSWSSSGSGTTAPPRRAGRRRAARPRA
jgi:hypothetical protein